MGKKRKNPAKMPESGRLPQGTQEKAGGPTSRLLKTCLLFVLYMAIFQLLLHLYAKLYRVPMREETAAIVSSLLNLMGIHNTIEGRNLFLRFDNWVITSECTGIDAVFLFASFVLAYASSLKAKVLALVPCIPLILAANIARLVVLGWVTEHWPRYAHIVHDYIWESIFLFLIVALWLAWIGLVVNREKAAAVSA